MSIKKIIRMDANIMSVGEKFTAIMGVFTLGMLACAGFIYLAHLTVTHDADPVAPLMISVLAIVSFITPIMLVINKFPTPAELKAREWKKQRIA